MVVRSCSGLFLVISTDVGEKTGKVEEKSNLNGGHFGPTLRVEATHHSIHFDWIDKNWIEFRPMLVSVCNVGDKLIYIFAASRVQNGRPCVSCVSAVTNEKSEPTFSILSELHFWFDSNGFGVIGYARFPSISWFQSNSDVVVCCWNETQFANRKKLFLAENLHAKFAVE